MSAHDSSRPATAADIAELDRHEVIGGLIVEKAGPSGDHAGTQATIAISIGAQYLGRGGSGGPGGWWIMTECEIELGAHEVYVPDIVGWRLERTPDRPRTKPVKLAPDWICEVLSPSTAAYDLGHKRRVYHQAGIPHLWIADPQNLTLTVLQAGQSDYEVVLVGGVGDVVRAEPFEAAVIAVAEIFGLER